MVRRRFSADVACHCFSLLSGRLVPALMRVFVRGTGGVVFRRRSAKCSFRMNYYELSAGDITDADSGPTKAFSFLLRDVTRTALFSLAVAVRAGFSVVLLLTSIPSRVSVEDFPRRRQLTVDTHTRCARRVCLFLITVMTIRLCLAMNRFTPSTSFCVRDLCC